MMCRRALLSLGFWVIHSKRREVDFKRRMMTERHHLETDTLTPGQVPDSTVSILLGPLYPDG